MLIFATYIAFKRLVVIYAAAAAVQSFSRTQLAIVKQLYLELGIVEIKKTSNTFNRYRDCAN